MDLSEGLVYFAKGEGEVFKVLVDRIASVFCVYCEFTFLSGCYFGHERFFLEVRRSIPSKEGVLASYYVCGKDDSLTYLIYERCVVGHDAAVRVVNYASAVRRSDIGAGLNAYLARGSVERDHSALFGGNSVSDVDTVNLNIPRSLEKSADVVFDKSRALGFEYELVGGSIL